MSAESLERSLAALGLRGRVEVRGSLAVLAGEDPVSLEELRLRDAAVSMAVVHGYTHLALELLDDVDDDASLPRA